MGSRSTQMKFLVPVKNDDGTVLIVRDPVEGMTPLPEAGAMKPWNSYWRRRVIDGSVVISQKGGEVKPIKEKERGDK